MSNFKVGDIIIGKPSGNTIYRVTSEKNGFVGKVKRVYGRTEMEVQVLMSDFSSSVGDTFDVESKHFQLCKDNLITKRLRSGKRSIF